MNLRTPILVAVSGLFCLVLGACAGRAPGPTGSPARQPDATIIVPGEESALAQDLRRNLAERGWTLTRYDAAMLKGNVDYEAMARKARYRLTLSGTQIGACRNGEPSFLYNLAIIENRSGDVPLALSGVSCLKTVIRDFANQLDQKQIVPPFGKPQTNAAPTDAPQATTR